MTASSEKAIHAHYPALDGLRTIAVIMVFCQHYGAAKSFICGWGWMGVDVFFVLSGFLITGILFDSQKQPKKYLNFYMRRILRIFPLYYFLWLLFLVIAPLAHWTWDWRWGAWPLYLGNYASYTLLHPGENIYEFTRITMGANITKIFGYPIHLYIGHFWSLCVEEQFYLIWPLMVYKLADRKMLIKICAVLIIAMPLIRWLIAATVSPKLLEMELLYRSMPTRVDALLVGGLAALIIRGPAKETLFRIRYWLIFGASILLIIAYQYITNVLKIPFRGSISNWISIFGYSLIDLCALGILLDCIKEDGRLKKVLSIPLFRNFGIITYGFYVYHDLLHDFYGDLAGRLFHGNSYIGTAVIAFFSTWIIALLSYKFLETPMLRLKKYFPNQLHRAPTA